MQGYTHHQSQLDQLEGYDWSKGLTKEQEHHVMAANPCWVTAGSSIDLYALQPPTTPPGQLTHDLAKDQPEQPACHSTKHSDPTANQSTQTQFPSHFYTARRSHTVTIDDTPARQVVINHHIAEWTLAPDEDIRLLNLGTDETPRMVKVNRHLSPTLTLATEALLHEFKDIFAWSYQDLRGVLAEICQHRIELKLDTVPVHQRRYRMNPNYAEAVKKDLDKLLAARFIYPTEAASWLSPIVVVPKKNGKLQICVDYRRLNAQTVKDPYPLPYMDTILDESRWSRDV